MQHIFIIGSKGIPAQYGGFETFVDELITRKSSEDIQYHVACMGNKRDEFQYQGCHCFQMKTLKIGAAKAVAYDLAALRYCINYITKYNLKGSVVYILACRIGTFLKKYKSVLHTYGCKVYVNPDGHEWKRGKWNYLIQNYWKWSEKCMVKHSDLVICDSMHMEDYIRTKYVRNDLDTTYIAYGAEIKRQEELEINQLWVKWCAKKRINRGGYYLLVSRFVPENNFETIINEFMKSKTKKDLVIITNIDSKKFYQYLRKKTNFHKDPRIKFVGTVYHKKLLMHIRENAFAYLHGHEVGGTNPSLLEALASTSVNLLLDVNFNREVAMDGALYWTKEQGMLSDLIHYVEEMEPEQISQLEQKAKNRIIQSYSWDSIVAKYETLFLKKDKRVSVVMASYQGERYIEEQLTSILKNLGSNDELIVSDDGSTDETINIVKRFVQSDERVRLLQHHTFGVVGNFEYALQQAEGKYIFLADQDDIWYQNKIEMMLPKLKEYELVVHNARIRSKNHWNGQDFFSFRNCGAGFWKNLYQNTFIGCCMAFQSHVLDDVLPFPNHIPMHDQWIGLVCESKYQTYFYDETLIDYRRYSGNVSTFQRSSLSVMLRNRIVLLINLCRRLL